MTMCQLRNRFNLLDSSEEVRGLNDDTGHVRGKRGIQLIQIQLTAFRKLDRVEVNSKTFYVGVDDLPIFRVHRPGYQKMTLAVDSMGHQNSFGQRRASVPERSIGHIHTCQLRHVGLEFEDCLQRPLGDFSLVRRIGCEELRS